MPIVSSDDNSDSGNSDNGNESGPVQAEPPDFSDSNSGPVQAERPEFSDSNGPTIVAEPPDSVPRGSPNLEGGQRMSIGREDMERIARADPDEGRRMLDKMEEEKRISEVREENEKLRDRVNRLEDTIEGLRSYVRTLAADSDAPLDPLCQHCGGGLKHKNPVFGPDRVECEECGHVEAGERPQEDR